MHLVHRSRAPGSSPAKMAILTENTFKKADKSQIIHSGGKGVNISNLWFQSGSG